MAVPEGRCEQPVREFTSFTADLYRLADWQEECGVDTMAVESIGYRSSEVLKERGFQVMLGDPRRIKKVPRRKCDVLDCQWMQEVHTYEMLSAAFRPEADIRHLRSYLRQRAMQVEYSAQHVLHMQRALTHLRGKRAVCGGRSRVRGALYMGTLTATRWNPVIPDLFSFLHPSKHSTARGLVVSANRRGGGWRAGDSPSREFA